MPNLDSPSPSPQSAVGQLTDLAQIIQDSVSTIGRYCEKNDFTFPSLDDPFHPASEAFRADDEANAAANKITAAAFQLLAAVMPPPASVLSLISGHFQTAALRVCLEGNITEILREAGPEGLHIDLIAQRAKLPSGKLGRLIRHLATRHVYKEIKPDVFTNTRLSTVMDSFKSVDVLQADPAGKHDDTSGFPALLGHHYDEVPKSSAYLWETLSDPAVGGSGEVTQTPFNRALNTELPVWTYFEQPDQSTRLKRFGAAMRGVVALQPPNQILEAYDWDKLPQGAVVVDIGGGVGTSALELAQKYDHLNVVVQDRPSVVEEGTKIWETKLPAALKSGRAKLQEHDFFEEQPVKNASVFLLKQILHDWADPYCVKILTQLRLAATPDTKLVLMDSILPHACPVPTDDETHAIPGAVPREAAAPLIANYGVANGLGYAADLTMMVLFNSQERTVKHLKALLKSTGWELIKVKQSDGVSNFLQPCVAVPIML